MRSNCRSPGAGSTRAMPDVLALAQGGTAVGTGINAPEGFASAFAAEVAGLTGLAFSTAHNKFEALAAQDALVAFSGALTGLAVALTKIANDIRLLGSGPRAGLGEIRLPENEPGSSIMPGKVNPTQCEMLTMVAAQVIGNHQAVIVGGMQGHLELNVFRPMICGRRAALDPLAGRRHGDLRAALRRWHRSRKGEYRATCSSRSLMLVTALAPHIGYENAARIAKHAHAEDLSLRDAALQLGLVDGETFDRIVDPARMVGPPGKVS